MPVDKFSIFNSRKGNANDEIVKSPAVKQPRKEEASRQQGEVSFYGKAEPRAN